MKISQDGIDLIKHFEGCELEAYRCSGNVPTIGYGHTSDVSDGDSCTLQEAEELLTIDLEEFERYVDKYVEVALEQHQFDALVSWTFNLGPSNLKSSTLLRVLNDDDYDGVPQQIKRWNKAGGKVLDGLVRRREAEARMFSGEKWSDDA